MVTLDQREPQAVRKVRHIKGKRSPDIERDRGRGSRCRKGGEEPKKNGALPNAGGICVLKREKRGWATRELSPGRGRYTTCGGVRAGKKKGGACKKAGKRRRAGRIHDTRRKKCKKQFMTGRGKPIGTIFRPK